MLILPDEFEGSTYFDVYLSTEDLLDLWDRKMISKCTTVNGYRYYIGVMNQNLAQLEDDYEEKFDEEEIQDE